MSRPRIASAALVAVASLGLSACWPQAGQNPDRTAHNPFERRLTTETVAGLTRAWHIEGAGTPVSVAGDVLVTAGSDLHRVDAATGAIEWTWTSPPEEGIGATTQLAPVVAERKVLATYSQYVAGGGYDYAGQALDPATGTPVAGWDRGLTAMRWPLVARQTTTCPEGACVPSQFEVIDAAAGETVQSGWLPLTDMTMGRDGLYGGSVTFDGAFAPTVAALPYETPSTPLCGPPGYQLFPCPSWSTPVGGAPTPVVIGPDESVVYAGTDAGAVVALDAAGGTLLWSTPVGGAVPETPALADGVLYVGTTAETVVAVDAASGQILWSADAGTGAVLTQPAVGGTGATAVVYAGTMAGDVTALAAAGCGAPTCNPLWTASVGSPVSTGPVVTNGTLLVGTTTELVAFRPSG